MFCFTKHFSFVQIRSRSLFQRVVTYLVLRKTVGINSGCQCFETLRNPSSLAFNPNTSNSHREKFRTHFKISPPPPKILLLKNSKTTCTENRKIASTETCGHIHSLFTLFSGAMGKRPWSAVASSPISRFSPRRLPLPASQPALSLRPCLEGVDPLAGLVNPPSSRVKEHVQTTI